ncbi:hypothetical protein [uncultured Sphingomonas sp.]|uniref:hypothetical protein n=1 Tax=uncultured Sphingomonas sp. TaxID=158754 RepID=UPI0025EB1328|nr:hypothetical protein [uncultured Sphingomonas sp.]
MSAAGQVRHVLWRRVGDNALRLIAALPVGYAVASLWSMALARILPGDPVQATIAAALIALVLSALAAMWAYAARSGWRALWTLVVAGAVAGGICWGSIAVWGRI